MWLKSAAQPACRAGDQLAMGGLGEFFGFVRDAALAEPSSWFIVLSVHRLRGVESVSPSKQETVA